MSHPNSPTCVSIGHNRSRGALCARCYCAAALAPARAQGAPDAQLNTCADVTHPGRPGCATVAKVGGAVGTQACPARCASRFLFDWGEAQAAVGAIPDGNGNQGLHLQAAVGPNGRVHHGGSPPALGQREGRRVAGTASSGWQQARGKGQMRGPAADASSGGRPCRRLGGQRRASLLEGTHKQHTCQLASRQAPMVPEGQQQWRLAAAVGNERLVAAVGGSGGGSRARRRGGNAPMRTRNTLLQPSPGPSEPPGRRGVAPSSLWPSKSPVHTAWHPKRNPSRALIGAVLDLASRLGDESVSRRPKCTHAHSASTAPLPCCAHARWASSPRNF